LSPEQLKLQTQTVALGRRLHASWQRYLQQHAQQVDHRYAQLTHPARALKQQQSNLQQQYMRLTRGVNERLRRTRQQQAYLGARFAHKTPDAQIVMHCEALSRSGRQLARAQSRILKDKFVSLRQQSEQLDLVSPLAVLGRGYSIVRNKSDAVIRRPQEVGIGEEISIQLNSGKLDCEVIDIHEADS
jgi:exodeoxyribonuclease VII large subunit